MYQVSFNVYTPCVVLVAIIVCPPLPPPAYGNDVMSAQMLEVSLSGVGTVLGLERDMRGEQMVKRLRQATNEYPPPRNREVEGLWSQSFETGEKPRNHREFYRCTRDHYSYSIIC